MGKYRNSDLHQEFSDFHWKLANKCKLGDEMLLSDIDRIWMPVRYGLDVQRPICVVDLKRDGDSVSFKEEQLYNWFLSVGVPVYLLIIKSFQPIDMIVAPYPNGTRLEIHNETEYLVWELQTRGLSEQVIDPAEAEKLRFIEMMEAVADGDKLRETL